MKKYYKVDSLLLLTKCDFHKLDFNPKIGSIACYKCESFISGNKHELWVNCKKYNERALSKLLETIKDLNNYVREQVEGENG